MVIEAMKRAEMSDDSIESIETNDTKFNNWK